MESMLDRIKREAEKDIRRAYPAAHDEVAGLTGRIVRAVGPVSDAELPFVWAAVYQMTKMLESHMDEEQKDIAQRIVNVSPINFVVLKIPMKEDRNEEKKARDISSSTV